MGWISKAAGAVTRVASSAVHAVTASEARSLTTTSVWGDWAPSHSINVNGDGVVRLAPVWAAINFLSGQIASLPVDFGHKVGGVRLPLPTPGWFRRRPDPRLSRFDWWVQCVLSLMLRGNAFGYVVRVQGRIVGVRWIHPDKVTIDESKPTPVYTIFGDPIARLDVAAGGDLLHIRWMVLPGSVRGLNPIEVFRLQFETAAGVVEYGHDSFENGILPTGILKNTKQSLDPDQTAEAKRLFMAAVKRGEPVALDENWSWETLTIKPADMQFLETIKASATVIATIFGLDPDEIGGERGDSLTYSTIEGNQRRTNQRTLLPWVRRLEEAFQPLLDEEQPDDIEPYLLFNLDALARPDAITVARIIHQELVDGTLTLPEARALRDRPPLTVLEVQAWQALYAGHAATGDALGLTDLLDRLEAAAPPRKD